MSPAPFSRRLAVITLSAALAAPFAVMAQDAFVRDPAKIEAGSYRLDPGHSKVTWSVNHFGFSTYMGAFGGVTGDVTLDPKAPAAATLAVTVDANSVGTLNPALDAHLKTADFLDTAKFPTATFKATGVTLTGERTGKIAGELTLRGVTKPVTLDATFNQAGIGPVDKVNTVGFDAKAVIKRSEFGISYALPAIGDEVTLTIEAELKKVP